jgi:hypothetical protein
MNDHIRNRFVVELAQISWQFKMPFADDAAALER